MPGNNNSLIEYEGPPLLHILYDSTLKLRQEARLIFKLSQINYSELTKTVIPNLRAEYKGGDTHRIQQIKFIEEMNARLSGSTDSQEQEKHAMILVGAMLHRLLRIERNYAIEKPQNKIYSLWQRDSNPENSELYKILQKRLGKLDKLTCYNALKAFYVYYNKNEKEFEKLLPYDAKGKKEFKSKLHEMVIAADKESKYLQYCSNAISFLRTLAEALNKPNQTSVVMVDNWREALQKQSNYTTDAMYKVLCAFQEQKKFDPRILSDFQVALELQLKQNETLDNLDLDNLCNGIKTKLSYSHAWLLTAGYLLLLEHHKCEDKPDAFNEMHFSKEMHTRFTDMLRHPINAGKAAIPVGIQETIILKLKLYFDEVSPELDASFSGKNTLDSLKMLVRDVEHLIKQESESTQQNQQVKCG